MCGQWIDETTRSVCTDEDLGPQCGTLCFPKLNPNGIERKRVERISGQICDLSDLLGSVAQKAPAKQLLDGTAIEIRVRTLQLLRCKECIDRVHVSVLFQQVVYVGLHRYSTHI